MKKASLALAVLAASTSAAWAQSSVTLYGIVDVGVRYTSNEQNSGSNDSVIRVIGGGMSNSRLGVNVTEDMGGGLKALVNLESRLNADTGNAPIAGGYPFWMQSWVGLQGGFGRVTLGRQYNVLFDLVTSTYASYPYSPYFDAYKPEIGLSLGSRADNMVKYVVESGPFRAGLQVSAGEGNATTGGKTVGFYGRYSDNGLSAGAGYESYQLGSGKKVKATTFGGSYRTGAWYLNAGYAVNKLDSGYNATDLAALAGVPLLWGSFGNGGIVYTNTAIGLGINKRTMWSVGVGYQVTAQLNLGSHYYRGKQSGPGVAAFGIPGAAVEGNADFWSFAADYAFSKRTDAYLEMDHTKVGGPNTSLTGVAGAANGAKSRNGFTVGLRHRF